MRIELNGNQVPIEAFAVDAVEISDWMPKQDYETKEAKLSVDGRQLYTTGKMIVFKSDRGAEKGVFFSVLTPVELNEMGKYRPAGKAWYTPFVGNDGRIKDSFVFETLEPVRPVKGE